MKNIFQLDFSYQINTKTEKNSQFVEAETLNLAKTMVQTFTKSIYASSTNFVFFNSSRQLTEKQKALVCPGKLITASNYKKLNNKIK